MERNTSRFVIWMSSNVSFHRLNYWVKPLTRLKFTKLALVMDGAERYGARVLGDRVVDLIKKDQPDWQAVWSVGQIQMMHICKLRLAEGGRRAGQIVVEDFDAVKPVLKSMINRSLVPICCSNLGMSSEYLAARAAKCIDADVLIYLGDDNGIKGEDGKIISTINVKEYINTPGNPNFEKIMGASLFQGPTLIANGMSSLFEDIVLMRTGTKLSAK